MKLAKIGQDVRSVDSFETILKYLRTIKTSTGLNVKAHYVRKKYKTGEGVFDKPMKELKIEKHDALSDWHYRQVDSIKNVNLFLMEPLEYPAPLSNFCV